MSRERGRIALDELVCRHLPWFAFDRITVRQLLTHTSGLPRWASRTDLARSVRDLDGVRLGPTEYSDANYMVLGAMVEHRTTRPACRTATSPPRSTT
ncbi:serine hydrolase domain-containing protein [Actinoplanes sp. NPDC049596]|uniref:serine hydrolase domain-containing protein n=1 Tax=unclassified Actinoplanes TaxID=2626549 RepID=UPI00341F7BFC